MQHLWSVATWEIETHDDDRTSLKKIGAPVAEHFLDINGKPKRSGEFLEVPLPRDLYLLTAWYVHDFLDVLNVFYTDPDGEPTVVQSASVSAQGVYIYASAPRYSD